jgi:SAM-dependent methyltransferase
LGCAAQEDSRFDARIGSPQGNSFGIKPRPHYVRKADGDHDLAIVPRCVTIQSALQAVFLQAIMEELIRRLDELLRANARLVDGQQHPVGNQLSVALRDLANLKWNIKTLGAELAGLLYAQRHVHGWEAPGAHGLGWRCSTQADIESQWTEYWCERLRIAPLYHRKIWELCYVLQVLSEHGMLVPGKRGIGFGCGEEPLPSLLASLAIRVTVTDLPPDDAKARGWIDTSQHSSNLQKSFKDQLCTRSDFDRNVELRYVDMTKIPRDLDEQYDFCWSICALEHLGSIRAGQDFVANSIRTLKPGGIAVHTTEFNFVHEDTTIDDWPTVLFRRRDLMMIRDRISAAGCEIPPIDLDVGANVLDRFIDIPPYPHQPEYLGVGLEPRAHLKASIDGFPATCVGLFALRR